MVWKDDQGRSRGQADNAGKFAAREGAEASFTLEQLDAPDGLTAVLESAARLQELVPDAVLVGGSAAAMYAGHRLSYDHDHVLADLRDHFDQVVEAMDRDEGWVMNRARPGKLVLGQLGDIEAGVRQMIRTRPMEVADVSLPDGSIVRVPTPDEITRIKGYMIVKRNQTRDFLDVAALSDKFGIEHSARVLAGIDDYYDDATAEDPQRVISQLVRQLSAPHPKDSTVTRNLTQYKGLSRQWHRWGAVVEQCQELADEIVNVLGGAR